jgi:hypothetical protein
VRLQKTANALQKVGPYVGPDIGQSFAAETTWDTRSLELSAEKIRELKTISEQSYHHHVKKLISSIPA